MTWRAVTIAGQPPSARHVPWLTLAGSKISGSGGCNGFSGGACLDDVANEREMQFVGILNSKPQVGTRDGRLVLTGNGGEIVLESG